MNQYSSIRVLLRAITGLLTLVIVVIFAVNAVRALQAEQEARRVSTLIAISNDLFTATLNVRLERGAVNAALITPEPIGKNAASDLAELRKQSGDAVASALSKLATLDTSAYGESLSELRRSWSEWLEMRREGDRVLQSPIGRRPPEFHRQWVDANAKIVDAIDTPSKQLEAELSDSDSFIAEMIKLKQIAWAVRADTGDDRLLVRDAMLRGSRLTLEEQRLFAGYSQRIEAMWRFVREDAALPRTPLALKVAVEKADRLYFRTFRPVRDDVIDDLTTGQHVEISVPQWRALVLPAQQSMYQVAKTAFDLAGQHVAALRRDVERNFYLAILAATLFSSIGFLAAWGVFKRVVQPIAVFTETMHRVAEGDLAREIPFQRRADEIGLLARALRVFRDNAIETEKLHLAKAAAETANRMKSDFLANMSHELRTPLNAIIGFSEMIKRCTFGPLHERYREYASDIFESGTHLLNLINEILDLTKLETGQFQLREETFDLEPLIDSAAFMMMPQAEKAGIQLTWAVDKDFPLMRADEQRLRQVLLNLLSNAVKFTPNGGTVSLSVCEEASGARIVIADSGIGMSPDQIPRAMEPFVQIDSRLSRKYEGTGLGLPLAKHLVELHGGKLILESAEGRGTKAIILLPGDRVIGRRAALASAFAAS